MPCVAQPGQFSYSLAGDPIPTLLFLGWATWNGHDSSSTLLSLPSFRWDMGVNLSYVVPCLGLCWASCIKLIALSLSRAVFKLFNFLTSQAQWSQRFLKLFSLVQLPHVIGFNKGRTPLANWYNTTASRDIFALTLCTLSIFTWYMYTSITDRVEQGAFPARPLFYPLGHCSVLSPW